MPYKDKDKKREHDAEYGSKWEKRNRKKRSKEKLEIYYSLRREAIKVLGNKCITHNEKFGCECNDWRILVINHINGGGSKERKRINSAGIYRKIIKAYKDKQNGNIKPWLKIIETYNILCQNCNILYEYDR